MGSGSAGPHPHQCQNTGDLLLDNDLLRDPNEGVKYKNTHIQKGGMHASKYPILIAVH